MISMTVADERVRRFINDMQIYVNERSGRAAEIETAERKGSKYMVADSV